jgi:hypothetical protein
MTLVGVVGHHARSWLTIIWVKPWVRRRSSTVFAKQASAFKIDAGRGFVQHQKFGLLLEGQGQKDALHFAAGKGTDAAFHKMRGVDHVKERFGLLAGGAGDAKP